MIEIKRSRQWVANSMRPPLPFTKIVRALPVKLHVAPNIDRSPVYTMLLANHDLNEPYMAWKLSQFQQSQLSTLHKKLNIAVEVRVPLAILERSALNSGVPEFGLLIRSGRRAWCVGTQ